MPNKKAPTLKDIAELAEVSINTVSRTLNNKPDVNEETRKRVYGAAEKLNYRLNRITRKSGKRSIATLGVMVPQIKIPFFAELIQSIEGEAYRCGFSIILANTEESVTKENDVVHTFLNHNVAGILVAPSPTRQELIELVGAMGMPHVLVGGRFQQLESFAVLNDDASGAYLAVNHLIERGYRSVLFINGPLRNWSAAQRLAGYRQALEVNGLEFDESLVLQSGDMLGAKHVTVEYLANNDPPDAIFVFSDYMALGVMRALKEQNLRIPRDVAVMGFDGVDLGMVVDPPLSTVRQPLQELGTEGTRLLISIIQNPDQSNKPRQIMLLPELLIREST